MPPLIPHSSSTAVERVRVADQITRTLKREILQGSLARGTRLPAERDLAKRFGVSGPTIREAIRSLSTLGLVDVRHGSGAYVTADTVFLVATTLGAIIQLGQLGSADVLSVLGTLNRQAVAAAAEAATDADHESIRKSMAGFDGASTVREAAEALRVFYVALATGAHNPLLAGLCNFLTDIQVEVAIELAGDSIDTWRTVFKKLRPARTQLVAAIVGRDGHLASESWELFHRTAVDVIMGLPRAAEVRLTDPRLCEMLRAMIDRIDLN